MNTYLLILLSEDTKHEWSHDELKQHISSQSFDLDVKFHYFSKKDKQKDLFKLLENVNRFDQVIILCQKKLYKQLDFNEHLLIAFYIKVFDGNCLSNKNSFFPFVLRYISNLNKIDEFINKNNLSKTFKLPVFNFKNKDLENVVKSFSNVNGYVELENIKTLTKIPRKPRGNSETTCFVDDRKFYFELGHEQHGCAESKRENGHTLECYFKSIFRFGIALRDKRHFNVMMDKDNKLITADNLLSCHKVRESRKYSHFNIFYNDFIR